MSQVSRRILNKNLGEYIFEIFIRTIARLKTQTEIESFLQDLLSPPERIMLVKRLAIAVMLSKGYTFDQIDHTLKVSRPTITKVSYFLKHGANGYAKVSEEVAKDQRREALFDKIEEILLTLSPPKLYKSNAYEAKRKAGKELFRRKTLRDNF